MKLLILLLIITQVESFIKSKFLKRFFTVCTYNKKNYNAIISKNKLELESKINKKDLEVTYLDSLSGSGSQEILEIFEEIFKDVNTEYIYFLTIILGEFFKYTINEVRSIRTREEIARLLIKNVLIPMIIHDSLKLLFVAFKAIWNSLHWM
tara:strand:+ start:5966 stop:6418 length:453 start_codon:yes stop_codon:yes gene_type:complete